MKPRALITGITGQDGSYLAELLLEKGYEVHGVVRRVAFQDPQIRHERIEHLLDRIELHQASLESYASVAKVVQSVSPDECYHLAAQSFVSYSFEDEFATIQSNIASAHFALAAVKEYAPNCRFYFAGSSEIFGKADEVPQSELSRFHPRTAYGISKSTGFQLTRNYRENYGMFACSGLLYNHESPRRGHEFVTRKISVGVARIAAGLETELHLGNLGARRDWGHARDYVRAMWLMLQHDRPEDFVIGTGVTHTVAEFAKMAFDIAGLDWQKHVVTDPRFLRPEQGAALIANPKKAKDLLGWNHEIDFSDLVGEMVRSDIEKTRLP